MRRILLIAGLLVTGLTYSAQAQAQFSIAVKAGGNISKVDFQSYFLPGYHAGLAFLVKLGKIGIQPEVLFSRQGYIAKDGDIDLRYRFDYINVPILLKFYPLLGLNIQAGPQIGFPVGGTGEVLNQVTRVKSTAEAKQLIEDLDAGIVMGLGWDFPFGLTLDARYTLGLLDVLKDVQGTVSGIGKNQLIQVSVGYKFINLGVSRN